MDAAYYIKGFKNRDDHVITSFYKANEKGFLTYFREHYSKDEEYTLDLYQDSCIALWKNIVHGKLTEDNLKCPLSLYLRAIGRYTMMARDRKYREIKNDVALSRLFLIEDDIDELARKIELEDFVFRIISDLKPPCSVLLKAQYWDKLSGSEIAEKYGYSGADSVKTQKSKCIKKIRPLIEEFMRQ